jgi:hypothetical protein
MLKARLLILKIVRTIKRNIIDKVSNGYRITFSLAT